MPVGRVGGGTKLVVDGRILKALTGTGLDRARNADEVAAGGGPEGKVGLKAPN